MTASGGWHGDGGGHGQVAVYMGGMDGVGGWRRDGGGQVSGVGGTHEGVSCTVISLGCGVSQVRNGSVWLTLERHAGGRWRPEVAVCRGST